MKKVLLLMLFLPLIASAQEKVITEVVGLKFGSSYDMVKDKLDTMFGSLYDSQSFDNYDSYLYRDINYQGFTFDFMSIGFVKKGNTTLLDFISFFSFYKTKKEANQAKEKIAASLSKDHKIHLLDNDNIAGGTSPLTKDDYGFLVFVKKSTSELLPFFVKLHYGPYGYGK